MLEGEECEGPDNESILPRGCLQGKPALAPFLKKLFMAVLGPPFCMQASSGCGGLCCCGAWALGTWVPVVVARGFSSCNS